MPWGIAAIAGFLFFTLVVLVSFNWRFLGSSRGLRNDGKEEKRIGIFLLEALM